MSEGSRDQELRALLRARREREEHPAPAFRKLWSAARARRNPRWRTRRLRYALAAVALVAAVGAYAVTALRSSSPPDPALLQVASLSRQLDEWEAPLDFLLETPGIEILESAPQFGVDEFSEALERTEP